MGFILGVIIWILRLIMIAILVYFVMGFIAPTSAIMQKAKPYIEPILAPFRTLIEKYLPAAKKLSFDVSPIAAIVIISIICWLLSLLQRIF